MDENKMIRPMDFVRLTNIDELKWCSNQAIGRNSMPILPNRGVYQIRSIQ